MPSTLEQRRPREVEPEATEGSELQGPEIVDYDEAALQEFMDLAQTQLGADEARILESADRRMPDTLGIDPQKVESIFTGGNFARRMKSARESINELVKSTRDKILGLTPARPENDGGEVSRGASLDGYMAESRRTGLEAVQDNARLAELTLRGIRNAERVLGFIHYIEEKAAGHEERTLWIKDSEESQKRDEYENKGYEVYFNRHGVPRADGKVRLRVSKDVPFHFNMKDAKGIEQLVKSENDPVQFFELLRGLGYKMTNYDFNGNFTENVKRFLDNPHIMPLLQKLQVVNGTIDLPKTRYLFDGSREANSLLELAELDAAQGIFNEATLKNLSVISQILGRPIQNQFIKNWVHLANDAGIMEMLTLAGGNGTFTSHDDAYLIGNLEGFENVGIAGDIMDLVKKGYDPDGFGLKDLGALSMHPSVEDITLAVQEIKANHDFEKFILGVAAEMGIQPTINPQEMEKFRLCFTHPKEAFDLLRLAKEFGTLSEEGIWHDSILERIFSNESVIERITQSGFSDFLSTMKKAGYEPKFDEIFPQARTGSDLLDYDLLHAFTIEEFKTKFAEDENIALAKYVNLFGSKTWIYNIYHFLKLAEVPNALNLLRMLEQKFDHHSTMADGVDLKYIVDVLRDKEMMEDLVKPETETLFQALQKAGYAFRGEHIRDLIQLSADQDLPHQLSDSETAQFVKDLASTLNPITMKALAGLDPAWRPAFRTLAQEFGFKSSVHRNGTLDNFQALAGLSENPKIIETAKVLNKRGVGLHPVSSFDSLKVITEKNLIDVILQGEGNREVQGFLIKNADSITTTTKEKLSVYFTEIVKSSEGKTVRDQQMIRGEVMGLLLRTQEYAVLVDMGNDQSELEEAGRVIEKFQQFVEANKVSGKGCTIVSLLAMREYREGEDFSVLFKRMGKSLEAYQRLMEHYSPHNIPPGLRASIGMEYEITHSTSQAYAKLNNGRSLSADMQEISRFANVGKGMDAIFEIATKPTDNPYLMLLEMQLLQELEFVDLNFRQPGYERGSRGFHMTIGGEYGVSVNPHSNFLQNTLVMSGWGGINAGKDIDALSTARSNIRERNASSTQPVFENTRPAVEFRSLSLDTWEPFERAVVTSYVGAVAIQAFEKYVANIDGRTLEEMQADNPEKFYQLLGSQGFIREPTNDARTKQIIFEWAKLQRGVLADLADHNENFLQNEIYGYEDDRGHWVDASEFGGTGNRDRFVGVAGSEQQLASYTERTRINPNVLFEAATPNLANELTAITNLFIKSQESGGDSINASSSLDTTKVGRTIEDSHDGAKYRSFFDTNGKTREGYYYVQGGSEKMILHKTQMRLLEFITSMQKIIA